MNHVGAVGGMHDSMMQAFQQLSECVFRGFCHVLIVS